MLCTVANMNTTEQKKIAEWLDVAPSTLSNYFNNNRRVRRDFAQKLAKTTGVSFEDIMLSDGQQLKQKFLLAYSVKFGAES